MEPSAAQELARIFAPIHNLVYYSPEIGVFTERGMRGWWMAYFAYRAGPMGLVSAEVVTAAFYNFAPRMVERAVPGVWSIMSPAEAVALRLDAVDRAARRVFGAQIGDAALADAAVLARGAIEGVDVAGRPLFAGHASLAWPDEPHLVLWHALTLMREHRGDSHNLALAAAEVDGVQSHVLMAVRGIGNRASILPIRGWTEDEWDAGERHLGDRGWLTPHGTITDAGRAGRRAIETHTSVLALAPCRRLGVDGLAKLGELLRPYSAAVLERGGIPSSWPPPHLMKPNAAS